MKTKIAIKFGTGYKSVEAELVTVEGIACGVHKTPGAKFGTICWSVTELVTGLALAKSSKRQGAIDLATERIVRAGTWQVQAKLNAEVKASAPEGLEPLVIEKRAPAAKADVPHIVDLVAKVVPLNERERAAVLRALNSRTGQLKAKAPSAFGDADSQLAAAAWQGLQPNAFKIGIVSVWSLRGEALELYDRLSKVQWPAAFDKDKFALVNAGVW